MTQVDAPVAHVFIHDVEVGSIPLADYEAMLASVRKDWRIWLSGVAENLLWTAGCIYAVAQDYVRGLFISLALIAIYASFAPNGGELISFLRNAPAEELATAFRMTLLFGGTALLTTRAVSGTIWPRRLGGAFEREVHLRIRRLLEVPSDGPMRITWMEKMPVKSRGISFRDVMDQVRKFARSYRG